MSNLDNVRKTQRVNKITSAILGSTLALTAVAWGMSAYSSGEEYILQGASRPALISAVQAENGVIIHEFKIIQAVSAKLTDEQIQGISSRNAMIRFFNEEQQVGLSADTMSASSQGSLRPQHDASNSKVPVQVAANSLHIDGITGKGVTVAFIDSGLGQFPTIEQNTAGQSRNITVVNASGEDALDSLDVIGHGSHISSVLADSSPAFDQFGSPTGAHNGVAPDADLVMIKAFDEKGEASYASVLQGIEYAIANKDKLNIRVLNVAFSFPATSLYWEDPINQALMRAWDSGIAVVAPSGNGGNDKMAVGVPGNNPYVITVGAMDDNQTPFETSDDRVAAFSSFGPTAEGFLKPEVLAPGTNIKGLVANESHLASSNVLNGVSGTSQAAAITSGVVALMIQQDPSLTPDEIKCRLMATSTGVINATAAINSNAVGCANTGLNIFNDMNMSAHYFGPARFGMGVNDTSAGGREANGAIWPVIYKEAGKDSKGAIWPVINNEPGKDANGAIWPVIYKEAGKDSKGAIWPVINNEPGKDANGAIWPVINNEPGKDANGAIWPVIYKEAGKDSKGAIWPVINSEPGKDANGAIWPVIYKEAGKDSKGAIWPVINNEPGKDANGAIWPVIYKEAGKDSKGAIWPVIYKEAGKDSKGAIWPVINNEPGKDANGAIWPVIYKEAGKDSKGAIWPVINNEPGKDANGAIWPVVYKEAGKDSKGAIWPVINNEPGKDANGAIWPVIYKEAGKDSKGAIWPVINKEPGKDANGAIWPVATKK